MKKIRRVAHLFIFIISMTFVALGLCGCFLLKKKDPKPEPEHEHTFSTEWAYNSDVHYHESTCGHDVTSDYGPHDLEDEMFAAGPTGEAYQCKICKRVISFDHDYTEPEVLKEADICTDETFYRRTCRKCGFVHEYTKTGKHDFGEWELVSVDQHTKTCKICGYEATHSPSLSDDAEILKIATCTEQGSKKGSCIFCEIEVTVPISALGHAYKYEIINDDLHSRVCGRCQERDTSSHVFTKASQNNDGLYHYAVCDGCKNSFIVTHDFSDGECLCGLSYTSPDGLLYADTDGGLKITGIGSFTGTDLYVPSEHDGKRVVEIEESAFSGASALRSVYVPDSVTKIGEGAFFGCDSITSIRLPFIGAQKREATDLHQYPLGYIFGEIEYGTYSGRWQSFYDDSLTEKVNKYYRIPSWLTSFSIGGGALLEGSLSNCSVTRLVLEHGVTAIENNAFDDSLSHLSISDTVTNIADGIIENLIVNSMSVDENNENYSYVGKCFIDKREKTVLMAYSGCKIPDDGSVTKLRARAFYNSSFQYLPTSYTLDIPSGIEYIGDECFKNANIHVNIYSRDLKYIGREALRSCRSISGFTIDTDEDVYIGESAFAANLGSVKIKCANLTVGNDAFYGTGMQRLDIDCDTAEFGKNVLRNSLNLMFVIVKNSSNTVLGDFFLYGSGVSSVEISGLSSFGASAFEKCNELSTIDFSGTLEEIPDFAFSSCIKLYSVTLPNGLRKIGRSAFKGCRMIKTLEIPDSVDDIGYNLIDGCYGLTELKIPYLPGNKLGYLFSTQSYYGSYGVSQSGYSTLYIPKTLKKVTVTRGNVEGAFYGCESLTEIDLGVDGVFLGSISSDTFKGTSITTLDVPDGCTLQRNGPSFSGMSKVETVIWRLNTDAPGPYFDSTVFAKKVIIEDNVTSIGTKAFFGMGQLNNIVIPDSVTSIGDFAFGKTSLRTLRLPFPLEKPLGYLFSDTNSGGEEPSVQITDEGEKVFYIPETLYSVTVGGNIPRGAFMNCRYLSSVMLTGENVELGDYAFYNSGLYRFEQPNVIKVGVSAFEGCSLITNIKLGALAELNAYTFKNSKKLSSLVATLPSGLTAIPDGLFDGCAAMTEFDIPSTVRTIGERAFAGTGITAIALPELLTTIKAAAFDKCVGLSALTIPTTVNSIGDNAFRDCSSLASVTLPSANATLSSGLFSGCAALTSMVIPSGVTSIGEGVFKNCTGLESVYWNATACTSVDGSYSIFENCEKLTDLVLGDNVTIIPDYAFYDCSEVESLTIPNSVTSIGSEAFKGCTKLVLYCKAQNAQSGWNGNWNYDRPVVLNCDNNIFDTNGYTYQYIGSIRYRLKDNAVVYYQAGSITGDLLIPETVDFDGDQYDVTSIIDNAFRNCKKVTGITVGNGVSNIGEAAFRGCSGLLSVIVGDGVLTIGESAFKDCAALTELTLGSHVASIGWATFDGCSKLASIVIPDSVTSIDADAFNNCVKLASVSVGSGVTSISGSAFSGCSNIESVYWNVTEIITVDGDSPLFASSDKLSSFVIGDDIMDIPDNAFKNWFVGDGLSVSMHDIVDTIGESAFEGCTAITELTLGSGVRIIGDSAFSGCTNITNLIIPDFVSTVGKSAFEGCTGITDIYVGVKVYDIDDYAFYGCNNIASLSLSGILWSIGEGAFKDCTGITELTLADNLSIIGDSAFYGCTGITSLNVPRYVGSIYDSAFYGCTGITELALGSGVRTIGDSSFYGCTGITEIELPYDMRTLGNSAFYNCTGVTSVSIGGKIESIGSSAFRGCSKLENLSIISKVLTSIGANAFYGCPIKTASIPAIACGKIKNSWLTTVKVNSGTSIEDRAFDDCARLTSVTLESYGITSIGAYAFRNCENLPTIKLPLTLTTIDVGAFYWCKKLTNVNIPTTVTSIGSSAFYYCSALTGISIPSSVTRLGGQAFHSCIGLKSVHIGSGVTTVEGSTFSSCTALATVTVYDGSLTKIDMSAFYNCSALWYIKIPGSVNYIGDNAFENCGKLSTIIFGGTMNQWTKSVSRGSFWNRNTGNYTIQCSDGDLSK